MSTFNVKLAKEVLGHLLLNPESHDQGTWFKENCKTVGCLAGWATSISGRTMIRRFPGDHDIELVSAMPAEVKTLSSMGLAWHMDIKHYSPTPEFARAVSEYRKSVERNAPAPKPWPNADNHNVVNIAAATTVRAAAILDLGISTELADYLFMGNRHIGEITAVLGIMIANDGDEEKALAFINGNDRREELTVYQETMNARINGMQNMLREFRATVDYKMIELSNVLHYIKEDSDGLTLEDD